MATLTDLDAKRVELNDATAAYRQAVLDFNAGSATQSDVDVAKAAAQQKGDDYAKLAGQVKKDNPGASDDSFFSNPTVQNETRRNIVRRAQGLNAALIIRVDTEGLTAGAKTASFQFKSVGTNVEIDWGDGTIQNATGPAAHEYATPGVYDVEIRGEIHGYDNGLSSMRNCIVDVLQWGDTKIFSAYMMFNDCDGLLTVSAPDKPNFQPGCVTDYMFYSCRNFNANLNHWDMSNVVSVRSMFSQADAFNSPLNNWDMSNVVAFDYMFGGADVFNQPIGNWDVSSGKTFNYMFTSARDFNQSLNGWRFSASGVDFYRMFESSGSFNQPLDQWNTGGVTRMARMFYASVFNQDISMWDVSGVTDSSDFRTNGALTSANSPF